MSSTPTDDKDEGESSNSDGGRRLNTTSAVSARMSRVVRRDTAPELAIRREAHRRGLRYFVDRRPVSAVRTRADLVFPRQRLAVFVDGCFWHGCPEHYVAPKNNAAWWAEKIAVNRERDRRSTEALAAAGWQVLRAWEHEGPEAVVDEIQRALQGRSATP